MPTRLNGVRAGEPLPTRLKVLNWGANETLKGVRYVNETTVEQLPRTHAARKWDRPVIDIEHASVPGSPTYEAAIAHGTFGTILGHGVASVRANDGLYLEQIEWNDNSRRAYEFPDLSAAIVSDAGGHVIGMHSVAFCVHGAAEGITAFSTHQPQEGTEMNTLIAALLGLGVLPDPIDEDTQARAAAIGALLGKLQAEPAVVDKLLSLTPEKIDALLARQEAETKTAPNAANAVEVAEQITTLSANVMELKAGFRAQQRTGLLLQAAAQGKRVPQAFLAKHGDDIETLSAMIAELPAGQVPITTLSVAGMAPTTGAPASKVLTDVSALFGRKPSDLEEHA